ncbi:MAG TPA: triose-phosphate isomerase [Flavobacteriales bacterium]|jgi:triosephosphate isomerase|nr:triose-phosphate isomerase [Flavobacteriales bacterium]
MRTKIVAGNWKMNKTLPEAIDLINDLKKTVKVDDTVEVIIAPSFVNLPKAVEMLSDFPIAVSAQNMHFEDSGAYTGEVSADMLKAVGVNTVILGHSERRAYFNETNDTLKLKAEKAYEKQMMNIFCVGEKLEERQAGTHFEVVKTQLQTALFDLPMQAYKKIVIAYEPVWAIGTGETATPEQAQEMHQFIRESLAKKYGRDLANHVRILYGGSVKPGNAKEIFSQPDVDGGLIGGASLNANDFNAIIEAAKS